MISALVIDIILVVIFAAITVNGYRKGLIGSLLGLACLVVSVICASVFTPTASEWLNDNYVGESVSATVTSSVKKALNESGAEDKTEQLISAIDKYILSDSEDAANAYASEIMESGESADAVDKVCGQIAQKIAKPLCDAVAFFVIFVLSGILVHILAFILEKIFKLPVLKQANKLLGLLFGLLCAVVTLMVISRVFVCILPWLSGITGGQINAQMAKDSHLLSFFSEFNIFKEIIKDISALL